MAGGECFGHKVAAAEAVGADHQNFWLAHGSSTSCRLLIRAAALMGVLPMVSTARAAMQHPLRRWSSWTTNGQASGEKGQK